MAKTKVTKKSDAEIALEITLKKLKKQLRGTSGPGAASVHSEIRIDAKNSAYRCAIRIVEEQLAHWREFAKSSKGSW